VTGRKLRRFSLFETTDPLDPFLTEFLLVDIQGLTSPAAAAGAAAASDYEVLGAQAFECGIRISVDFIFAGNLRGMKSFHHDIRICATGKLE
jgi:hypothetical protein